MKPYFSLLESLARQMLEEIGSPVDLNEPFVDESGAWLPLAAVGLSGESSAALAASAYFPATDVQLAEIRRQCRRLALENEFAINGHENRISYIVGSGHAYRATARKCCDASPRAIAETQRVIDEFIELNHWHRRQQEIVRRRDRDGEAFLRFFPTRDGHLRVRFVEPDQIATPTDRAGDAAARLGILTDRDDVESVLGYFVDGRLVDANEIQHRKANVDANVRRGLPLFHAVRKNLLRAEKLLRNMSVVAEIQSAIALIRRHRQAGASSVQGFVQRMDDSACGAGAASGALGGTFRGAKHVPVTRYAPGAIIDAHGGIEYDFPASGVNASNYVQVLQAELRAIASRLVMPEFMLTSDASNANYASTMVAEGPAMRMFERLQAEQIRDDVHVMWRAVDAAISVGRLASEVRRTIQIQATAPSPCMRDHLNDAHRHRLEHAAGILSPQTWSQLAGLDYDQEQRNLSAHRTAASPGER